MTEVVTITEEQSREGLQKIKFAFTTHTDGTATGETSGDYNGLIYYVVSDPGSTAPTAAWDFQIQDEDNYDLLNGAGADRSATSTEYLQASKDGLGMAFNTKLTLEVSGGGDTKDGVVEVFIVS